MNKVLYKQILPMMEDEPVTKEKSEPVHVSEGVKKFAKRFQPPADVKATERRDAAPEPVTNKPPEQQPEPKAETKPGEEQEQKPDLVNEKPRGPGSNVPKILEDKRNAEKERDEARARLAEYETKKLPELNSKIDELQKKIDSGTLDPAKERTYEKRIEDLEKQRTEAEDKLRADLENTRRRLQVHDVTENPVYREKYLKPLVNAVEELRDFTTGNQPVSVAVQRATMLQKQALEATSVEDKRALENSRDEVIAAVMEGMNAVTARRFEAAFYKYTTAAENQVLALADFERTNEEVKKEWENQQVQTVENIKKDWQSKFDAAGERYKEYDSIPTDLQDKLSELGITIDLKTELEIGSKAIKGELNQEQTVNLIQQGARYRIVDAQVKALRAIVAEQADQLSKLRGAQPPSGERSRQQPAPRQTVTVDEKGQTRSEFNQRFKPPAGVV